jgi:hypothetical protein
METTGSEGDNWKLRGQQITWTSWMLWSVPICTYCVQAGLNFTFYMPRSKDFCQAIIWHFHQQTQNTGPAFARLRLLLACRLSAIMPVVPSVEGTQLPLKSDHEAPATAGHSSTSHTAPVQHLSSGIQYADQAGTTLRVFSERLMESAMSLPKMCCAVHLMLKQPLRQVRHGMAGV